MPDSTMQWIALFGFVIIGVFFALEVRRWRSVANVIGKRQRVLRVCLIVLIEALFALMFLGPWLTSRRDPIAAFVYWTVCVLLALGVVILALADLRAVFRGYAALNRDMFSDILSSLKERGEDRRDR